MTAQPEVRAWAGHEGRRLAADPTRDPAVRELIGGALGYDAGVHIVITGHDDVFAVAAAIEAAAQARGLAVVRDDRPVPAIDYGLEDLLGLRRSDLDVAIGADDAAWAETLAAVRAGAPGVDVTVE